MWLLFPGLGLQGVRWVTLVGILASVLGLCTGLVLVIPVIFDSARLIP